MSRGTSVTYMKINQKKLNADSVKYLLKYLFFFFATTETQRIYPLIGSLLRYMVVPIPSLFESGYLPNDQRLEAVKMG